MLRDVGAALVGIGLFALVLTLGCWGLMLWRGAACRDELRPLLGSGQQTAAIDGCLARDAGPLIAIRKALGMDGPLRNAVTK